MTGVRHLFAAAFFCCLLPVVTAFPARAHGLHFLTGDLPPYVTLTADGPPTGFAVDIMVEVMREAGEPFHPENLEVTNWARAVHEVQFEPDKALLALARLPAREDRFKWVGPVFHMRTGLFGRVGETFAIRGYADLARHSIVVVRHTAPEVTLLQAVPDIGGNLVRVNSIEAQLRMLQEGRVDLMAQGIRPGRLRMPSVNIREEEYPLFFEIEPLQLYLGFNKSVDDAYIQRLQDALDRLKTGGPGTVSRYERLLRKYGLEQDVLPAGARSR
jgi:polar amino acid transport system substrate-binding protein